MATLEITAVPSVCFPVRTLNSIWTSIVPLARALRDDLISRGSPREEIEDALRVLGSYGRRLRAEVETSDEVKAANYRRSMRRKGWGGRRRAA